MLRKKKVLKKQRTAIDFSGIEKSIVAIKGQNVILDSDVAKIYGVETREVNQAIKNNPDKFPAGYIVEADKDELIKNFDKFKSIRNYPGTPKAFSEKGLYMLATILKGPKATAETMLSHINITSDNFRRHGMFYLYIHNLYNKLHILLLMVGYILL